MPSRNYRQNPAPTAKDQTSGKDNTIFRGQRSVLQYAQNPFNTAYVRTPSPVPLQASATTVQTIANPLFGRPIWSYVKVAPGAIRGPQPRLAQGSGKTGGDSLLPGNSPRLPGYLSDQQYEPTDFTYAPPHEITWQVKIPRSIKTGMDGIDMLGTYRAHDFTPADRWSHHRRSAVMWEAMDYRPGPRNLLAWQQAARFRLQTMTLAARPLTQDQYFLGYQVQPQTAAAIGQSSLGYMGSQ